jgi:hypothetical protein
MPLFALKSSMSALLIVPRPRSSINFVDVDFAPGFRPGPGMGFSKENGINSYSIFCLMAKIS